MLATMGEYCYVLEDGAYHLITQERRREVKTESAGGSFSWREITMETDCRKRIFMEGIQLIRKVYGVDSTNSQRL
jgi:hypothetical protein